MNDQEQSKFPGAADRKNLVLLYGKVFIIINVQMETRN